MSMTKDDVMTKMREKGRDDALNLRGRAKDMTGTEIIAEKEKAPQWDGNKDYSSWPVGAPVAYSGRTYGLIQPHNAASYPQATPENTAALWSILHTTDPKKAEPYFAPSGTSGMYMKDDCCTEEGHVYKSTIDNNVWRPSGYPQGWTDLGTIEEMQGG